MLFLQLSGRARESVLEAGQAGPGPTLGHTSETPVHETQPQAMQITWEATTGSVAIYLFLCWTPSPESE